MIGGQVPSAENGPSEVLHQEKYRRENERKHKLACLRPIQSEIVSELSVGHARRDPEHRHCRRARQNNGKTHSDLCQRKSLHDMAQVPHRVQGEFQCQSMNRISDETNEQRNPMSGAAEANPPLTDDAEALTLVDNLSVTIGLCST